MNDVAIIGGGASGLFCAIYVKHLLNKENIQDVNITIYERLEKTGKKLLATGNGKCNFSNKICLFWRKYEIRRNNYRCGSRGNFCRL